MTARRPSQLLHLSRLPLNNGPVVVPPSFVDDLGEDSIVEEENAHPSLSSRQPRRTPLSAPRHLSLTSYGPDSLQQWFREQIVKARLESHNRSPGEEKRRSGTSSSSSQKPSPEPSSRRRCARRRVRRVPGDNLASDEADLDDDEESLSDVTDDSFTAPLGTFVRRPSGEYAIDRRGGSAVKPRRNTLSTGNGALSALDQDPDIAMVLRDLDSNDLQWRVPSFDSGPFKKSGLATKIKSSKVNDTTRRERRTRRVSRGQDDDFLEFGEDKPPAESGDEPNANDPSRANPARHAIPSLHESSPKRKSHYLTYDDDGIDSATRSRRRRMTEEHEDEERVLPKTSQAPDCPEHANENRPLLATASRVKKTEESPQIFDGFGQDDGSQVPPQKSKNRRSAPSIIPPHSALTSTPSSSSIPRNSQSNQLGGSQYAIRQALDAMGEEMFASTPATADDSVTTHVLAAHNEAEHTVERSSFTTRPSTKHQQHLLESDIKLTTIGDSNDPGLYYYNLVPEKLPKKFLSRRSSANKAVPAKASTVSKISSPVARRSQRAQKSQAPALPNADSGDDPFITKSGPFPRSGHIHGSKRPVCEPLPPYDASKPSGWPGNVAEDVYGLIAQYLSHADVSNLRLTSKTIAAALDSTYFRSVVTKFGTSMFDTSGKQWTSTTGHPLPDSVFRKHGAKINKFGISFEVDLQGLYSAEAKVVQGLQNSWWGKYSWPLPVYPRFPALQTIEDLVDHNQPLLKDAMKNLAKASELGLCIDSGHGWMNGPDQSDMALYESRCAKGTKVFGKSFSAEDKWHTYGKNALYEWAQRNTLNEAAKCFRQESAEGITDGNDIKFLRSVAVREMSSFELPVLQSDHDPLMAHTGGNAPPLPDLPTIFAGTAGVQPGVPAVAQPNLPHAGVGSVPVLPTQGTVPAQPQREYHLFPTFLARRTRCSAGPVQGPTTQPQWPIIFNGFNIAAEVGGTSSYVQSRVSSPAAFPLQPAKLTEAQAQWLMETVWAQRAFLSAYTTSVITNKLTLSNVHTLTIAKISSGLLPSLEQREFWTALPQLTTLKILVSPDWRTEHMPGDRAYQQNMLLNPVHASIRFAEFLHRHISKIEHLSTLTIGFIGGGEHADGIFARNQHVLPAPVTLSPRAWLSDHTTKPNIKTMMKFNHIKNLTFKNCWFSPIMLKQFMTKSSDTSLRRLTLDSVSLTTVHSSRTDGPLTRRAHRLDPVHAPEAWLQERLPSPDGWPGVLDSLTPGKTFCERKYDSGILVEIRDGPLPDRGFRGHVQTITLNSCGYIYILGVHTADFNQSDLVGHEVMAMDEGVQRRGAALAGTGGTCYPTRHRHGGPHNAANPALQAANPTTSASVSSASEGRIMMSRIDPSTGTDYFGLGVLTQAIHPIEKRVLEQAWNMRFGWGNDMKRWRAVEDGCFEGGTGRFSGSLGIE